MITLLSAEKKQFKANLHCHSTFSDGKLTPEELKEAYRDHGYSVLAITDHEKNCDHSDLTDPEFLMLTGYEIYIRPDPNGKFDKYFPEVHMNLFARNPHNDGMIAFSPSYAHYLTEEQKANAKCLGDPILPRAYMVGYVNHVVEEAKANGFIVGYNHPFWSMEEYDTILGYRGFFSMEMCNYSSFVTNHLEYNGALYEAMLRHGIRIGCNSSDDNHNKYPFGTPQCDSFGGFTYILADKLEYDDVFRALENGQFYSSMGPQIYEVTVEGNIAHMKTSPCDILTMYNGGKAPISAFAEHGEKITEASFTINERDSFIRFSAINNGLFADTRGFFRDEFREETKKAMNS